MWDGGEPSSHVVLPHYQTMTNAARYAASPLSKYEMVSWPDQSFAIANKIPKSMRVPPKAFTTSRLQKWEIWDKDVKLIGLFIGICPKECSAKWCFTTWRECTGDCWEERDNPYCAYDVSGRKSARDVGEPKTIVGLSHKLIILTAWCAYSPGEQNENG